MFTGIDDPTRWILPRVLEEMATVKGQETWISTTDGDQISFFEMADDARKVASYFASLGVSQGDFVAVWMPNGIDFVRAWLGLGRLGAVSVLLNTGLTGKFLKHQLDDSGVKIAVVDESLLPELEAVAGDLEHLETLVVVGSFAKPISKLEFHEWSSWHRAVPWDGPIPQAHDIASIMYTSGTTGPSKGVLMPHAHCTLYGIGEIECMQLTPEDKFYIPLPLFHANGLLMQLGATLLAGIPAVLRQQFSASAWLADVRRSGATVTNHLGATAAFVVNQPPSAQDKEHCLRQVMNAPNLPEHEQVFRKRFGIPDVVGGFGMTEVNIPIWGRKGSSVPGAAGWAHEHHFDVTIADPETDAPIPAGELGEILVRPKVPFGFMAGYHNLPGKTVEAWRNLWFHTEDAGTMSADGLVTFVDRIKDCIRRRGENISAAEVESAVSSLPDINEVAAYAVQSDLPGAEDEVMLAIVPEPGTIIDHETIGPQVDALLPRFARPRFIRLMEELPKTATGKVQRQALKKVGATNAVDRDNSAA